MQRSTNTGRMTFGKRRYTAPSFMSKPKPLKSEEQLMEEIMLGTRDLPNLKKPLSAKFDESQLTSPTPSTSKSSVSTASTMALSEQSPGPFQSSILQDDNGIPPTPVLETSSSQSELVSPLPTPLTTPTSSPGVLSRKSRSRRVQPHTKTAVSTRRSLRDAQSLSDRRLQQMRNQGNQTSDPSMMPPAPSLETIESGIVLPTSSGTVPSSTKAPRESKSPVRRRKSAVRDPRSISDKKLQQHLSGQHKRVSDPSIVSAPLLGTKDPSNVRTNSKSPTPRRRGSVRANSKSPTPRKRGSVRASISGRRLQQVNGQHAQVSDTSVVSAPPLETKDNEDDKVASRSKARASKSPVPRKRGYVRAARTSISDRRLQKTNIQPEQVADSSIPPTPLVGPNDDGDDNDLPIASSKSPSLRENGKKTRKRGNNRNSIRSPSLSNGEEEGKQRDLSVSVSSRGTQEAFTSTRSSSSNSLSTLQSKRTADRTRRRRLRESLQRTRSATAIASEPKHPGFIKSFLGTSENGTLAEDDFVPMALQKGDKAIRSGPV